MTNTKDAASRRSLHDIVRQVGEIETIRPAFEEWITSSPYEREIKRWPKDETKYAWPGQYCDITTQLAWEAWQESAFVHKLPNAVITHAASDVENQSVRGSALGG